MLEPLEDRRLLSIRVLGNGLEIADGDSTPNSADYTDFGTAVQFGTAVTRTFSIENTGTEALTLDRFRVPTQYTLVDPPALVIAPGGSGMFAVELATPLAGTFTGYISFITEDPNESQFNFAITATISPMAMNTDLIDLVSSIDPSRPVPVSGSQRSSSTAPCITPDGRYVAFSSFASNLVIGDTNGEQDVFVRDSSTGIVTRVSTNAAGTQANGGSYRPSISSDGRYVAFRSQVSNLVDDDTNGTYDIFVKDMATGGISRVSTDSAGLEANSSSDWPSISADGRYVAFCSSASNLVTGDTNGVQDVFVKDLTTGSIVRASTSSWGAQADGWSQSPSMSADGRYVAFQSWATNLAGYDGYYNFTDIFVKDLVTGDTTRVNTSAAGASAYGDGSLYPSISSDGRYVAFYSRARNLIDGEERHFPDIYVKDVTTGSIICASPVIDGWRPDGGWPDYMTSISPDDRYVTFGHGATNLLPGDASHGRGIYVWDIITGDIRRVASTEKDTSEFS